MSIAETAYTAGIVDGDGSIGLYRVRPDASRRSPYYRLHVLVSSSNQLALTKLKEWWGGTVTRHMKKAGWLKRPQYQWIVSNRQALAVIETILPYLIIKKERAWIGAEFYAQTGQGQPRRPSRLSAEQLALREGYALAMRNSL